MLAGNVTVTLDEFYEVLSITGDNKANQFIIVAGAGDTTVTGLDGTTINGVAEAYFDDFYDLEIDTGNGDDEVEVVDMISALSVKTGNGNDTVLITEDEFFPIAFDYFDIDTGNGNDRVELWNLNTLFCDMNITMGKGDDYLRMLGTIQVLGAGTIDMGKGDDTIDEKFLFDYVSFEPLVVIGNETVLPPLFQG
jgi:hypothetical protein